MVKSLVRPSFARTHALMRVKEVENQGKPYVLANNRTHYIITNGKAGIDEITRNHQCFGEMVAVGSNMLSNLYILCVKNECL